MTKYRVVPFAEFAASIRAAARGEKAPGWAGKTVYATESARKYWTEHQTDGTTEIARLREPKYPRDDGSITDEQLRSITEAVRAKHGEPAVTDTLFDESSQSPHETKADQRREARVARAWLGILTMTDEEIQRDIDNLARFLGIEGPSEIEPGMREVLDKLYKRYGPVLQALADESDDDPVS